MARRMRNVEFRNEQLQRRFDEHIAPINRLVEDLRRDGLVPPYVAPMYGGVRAKLLSILRDPGPKTQEEKGGSGFLCMENDDATAESICKHFADVKIEADDIVPWNAYPWYINRAPKASELNDGIEPLKRVIDLLPELRVVMLHGGSAHDGWDRLIRKYPEIAVRGLKVIETYHTSPQAFRHPDKMVREDRKEHLRKSFHDAASYLRNTESA
jgi:hypothetical protein